MIEFTLNVGDKLHIGDDIVLKHLPKTHPLAITAQMVRIGVEAPVEVKIDQSKYSGLAAFSFSNV